MKIQLDLFRLSLQSPLWELLLVSSEKEIIYHTEVLTKDLNKDWIKTQLENVLQIHNLTEILCFRPSILTLFNSAVAEISSTSNSLPLKLIATRHCPELKAILQEKYPQSDLLKLEKSVPQPLPEWLWGKEWQLANIPAGDILEMFVDRSIPFLNIPSEFDPFKLNLSSATAIPGLILEGGRNSLKLARFIAENTPFSLNYIPNEPQKSGGFILETGLIDRWVFLTVENPDIAQSSEQYENRKKDSQGLHFLLIKPDTTSRTYSGFWLLKND